MTLFLLTGAGRFSHNGIWQVCTDTVHHRITNKPLHGKVEGVYVHIPPTEALVELWQKLADDSLSYMFVYMG
jgi:hypothetical protein